MEQLSAVVDPPESGEASQCVPLGFSQRRDRPAPSAGCCGVRSLPQARTLPMSNGRWRVGLGSAGASAAAKARQIVRQCPYV